MTVPSQRHKENSVRTMIPVRCFGCMTPNIQSYYRQVWDLANKHGMTVPEAFRKVGVTRICCKTIILYSDNETQDWVPPVAVKSPRPS